MFARLAQPPRVGTRNQSNLGFVLAATLDGPYQVPAPGFTRALQRHQEINGDHHRGHHIISFLHGGHPAMLALRFQGAPPLALPGRPLRLRRRPARLVVSLIRKQCSCVALVLRRGLCLTVATAGVVFERLKGGDPGRPGAVFSDCPSAGRFPA